MVVQTIWWGAAVAGCFIMSGVSAAIASGVSVAVVKRFRAAPENFLGLWVWKPPAAVILKYNFRTMVIMVVLAVLLRIAIPWPVLRLPVMLFFAGCIMVPVGADIGFFLQAARREGVIIPTLAALVPHGIIEIPAVSGIFGYCLVLAAAPGSIIVFESFAIVGVLFAVLAVAAIIEGHISARLGYRLADRMGIDVD